MASLMIIDGGDERADELVGPLLMQGHDVRYLTTVEDATSSLTTAWPDTVLLGVGMLGRDCKALLKALCESCRRGLNVVLYSGQLEAGADGDLRRFCGRMFMNRGADWDETYARICACLGDAAPSHAPIRLPAAAQAPRAAVA